MFRKLTLLALLLTFLVLVLGAYLRLTDSGVGCADWPSCYGQSELKTEVFRQSDLNNASSQLEKLQDLAENPIILAHLSLSSALMFVLLLIACMAWWQKPNRLFAVSISFILLLLTVFQGLFGLLTLNLKLMPVIVTSHLVLGMVLFWLLFALFLRCKRGLMVRTKKSGPAGLAAFTMLLLVIQGFLGGWLSSNFAALSCQGLPLCNGEWWPDADYNSALDIFNGLFVGNFDALPDSAKIAVHWLHRVGGAVCILFVLLVFSFSIADKNPQPVRRGGWLLLVLVFIQISLGIINESMALPLWSAIAHHAISALLLLPLIYIRCYSRYQIQLEDSAQVPQVRDSEFSESDLILEPLDQVQLQPESEPLEKEPDYIEKSPETLFLRLQSQLKKTRSGLGQVLTQVSLGEKKIDADILEQIEAGLIMADVGIDATTEIINHLTETVERKDLKDADALTAALKTQLVDMLTPCNQPLQIPEQDSPFVILVVGVNGVGKTTTIGKMAKRLQAQGHSVMLAAGDTFRAAAVEQLQTWGERNNIHVVAQHTGADSASVLYDGVQSAQAKGIDVLIADTAGRLHTKSNLMEELKKVKRIISKLDPDAPHEVLLVLDSGTGQNALMQAKQFNDTVALTGIALTKLDGTAKGGVIFALAKQFGVPIRYIGIGEGIDDLQDFHAEQFVDALFSNN